MRLYISLVCLFLMFNCGETNKSQKSKVKDYDFEVTADELITAFDIFGYQNALDKYLDKKVKITGHYIGPFEVEEIVYIMMKLNKEYQSIEYVSCELSYDVSEAKHIFGDINEYKSDKDYKLKKISLIGKLEETTSGFDVNDCKIYQ